LEAEDQEFERLSQFYDALRSDAKSIVLDLQGGVTMWREAAGANLASAGFLVILALSSFRLYSPLGLETTLIIAAQLALAAVLFAMATFGLRKYFRLRKRYGGLFERAKKLE
jgi:hypothetical protein